MKFMGPRWRMIALCFPRSQEPWLDTNGKTGTSNYWFAGSHKLIQQNSTRSLTNMTIFGFRSSRIQIARHISQTLHLSPDPLTTLKRLSVTESDIDLLYGIDTLLDCWSVPGSQAVVLKHGINHPCCPAPHCCRFALDLDWNDGSSSSMASSPALRRWEIPRCYIHVVQYSWDFLPISI